MTDQDTTLMNVVAKFSANLQPYCVGITSIKKILEQDVGWMSKLKISTLSKGKRDQTNISMENSLGAIGSYNGV